MKIEISLLPIAQTPDLRGKITVPVYFFADGKVMFGKYHQNGCFYANVTANDVVIANESGHLVNAFGEGRGECPICEGWAYPESLNAVQPAEN